MDTKKRRFMSVIWCLEGFLLLAWPATAQAGVKTWAGGQPGSNWMTAANWSPAAVPGNGDDVFIDAASAFVNLTNSTANLGSLALSSTATLVFSNWDTALNATNVTIDNGARMMCAGPFINNAMSNRVWVIGSNLTIAAGGSINVNGKGWDGGYPNSAPGNGPGGGAANSGGSYGGMGGAYSYPNLIPPPYGSAAAPESPGSGGGANTWGDSGGGAVRIQASGAVVVNGAISADGMGYYNFVHGGDGYNGAGSGGAVYINCATLAGTNGLVSARGGAGYGGVDGVNGGCGGGGGRIAVTISDTATQNSLPLPGIEFCAAGGDGRAAVNMADAGTLYFPDNRLLTDTNVILHCGQWMRADFTNWSPTNLTFSNAWLTFPLAGNGFQLAVTNDFTIWGTNYRVNKLVLSNALLTCGGSLFMSNSSLVLQPAVTNSGGLPYSSLVSVTGDLTLAGSSWIFPYSHPTNGGSVCFRMKNLAVAGTGSGINADFKGYSGATNSGGNFGPGKGTGAGGAGYGGAGGYFQGGTGRTYGSATNPVEPGSGGGFYDVSCPGSAGGGLIWIEARSNIMVNGILTANGEIVSRGAGGSGGGIYLTCQTFTGTNGVLRANGGGNTQGYTGGGGGGGRVAVNYNVAAQSNVNPRPIVQLAANGGRGDVVNAAQYGLPGTLYCSDLSFFPTENLQGGQIVNSAFTNWAPNNLTVSNGLASFPDGFDLRVTNDITGFALGGIIVTNPAVLSIGRNLVLTNNGKFYLYGAPTNLTTMTVNGNLTVSNAGALYVFSGMTNGSLPGYGVFVSVIGDVLIADNSWIYPASHPTNGGSVRFQMQNLTVPSTNAGFNANGLGCRGGTQEIAISGFGPGGGQKHGGGGSYGGLGGTGYTLSGYGQPGPTYGSSNKPVQCGSGGGCFDFSTPGGYGGGLIWIEANLGTVLSEGTFTANGGLSGRGGGGSGGGIFVTCRKFVGSTNTLLSANGGNRVNSGGEGGSGGGGRIAVWRMVESLNGPVSNSVAPGTVAGSGGLAGNVGTVFWKLIPLPGTVFVVH